MDTQTAVPGLDEKTFARDKISWQAAAFGAIGLAACGHLIIKQGLVSAAHLTASTMGEKLSAYLFHSVLPLGLFIYGIGTLLWIRAVASRNISFLYPLTALNYVVVSIGGKVLFNEAISTGRWIGIAVVVLGVALLQVEVKEGRP